MKILVGVLLLIHGLITAMQSTGSFNPKGGVPNPAWLGWWPVSMGQSWLLPSLNIGRSFFANLLGFLWLLSGIALVAAALGVFGFIIPTAWWRFLAGIGAATSLLLFIIYAHPLYAVGIGANLAILVVLLWLRWPSAAILGS